MRRWWVRWSVGSVLLAAMLTLAAAWSLDRNALSQRRHMLGCVQYVCKLYAEDHDGVMPPDLRAVFPQYLNGPLFSTYTANDVEYLPGATEGSSPATVLLREKRADPRGRRWVAFVDMHLELAHVAP